ncbi:MAG: hypothetical protein NTW85_10430 [Methylococcales bacterium]|nr:hypothetical protein [Methylococcales bacterium]
MLRTSVHPITLSFLAWSPKPVLDSIIAYLVELMIQISSLNFLVTNWEHEALVERHKERMKQNPAIMKQRGALVEQPHSTSS